jgi:hypothetical protein
MAQDSENASPTPVKRTSEQIFQRFEQTVSRPRLKPYRRHTESKEEAVALYLWNMALAEALYPALGFFEVAFRNTLHEALSEVRGTSVARDPRWFMDGSFLEERHLGQVEEVLDRLRAQGKPVDSQSTPTPVEPGRVVADLSFGFWVALYSSPYTARIFHPTVARVFPKSPHSQRVQSVLHKRLKEILDLRNRIFHQESIHHWGDLVDKHKRLQEVLGWIEPDQLAFLQALDRFEAVHRAGASAFQFNAEFAILTVAEETP